MDDKDTTLALPDARAAQETVERALFEIRRVIAGQDRMLERVLVCLLAGGHLLIEGVPGLAKTLTIKTAAAALGGTFHRVQFTPDLVPSDLVGTRIFRPDTASFSTEQGPVFCNFLLAATRSADAAGIAEIGRYVEFGASPRGSISLVVAARALALIRGRDYVLPQDLAELAHDVLRHRLVLTYEAWPPTSRRTP